MKTEKKTAANAESGETGANMMDVAEIAHAPWNPRTPEELKPDHPAMVELIDSVKALGVVQPIAVWTGDQAASIAGDGKSALCIAGNRRLEAARVVGLKTIPVHKFTNLTEEAARAITRAENECRFGVSPLADAALVKSMLDIGRSQSEIAALVGVSEATVCRRAKLLDLSPEVVEAIGDAGNADARALEKIAAYPEDVQKKAVRAIGDRVRCGDRLKPQTVDWIFRTICHEVTRNLWIFRGSGGPARFERCASCPSCTGNQRELFDLVGDETHVRLRSAKGEKAGARRCLGQCLNGKCFREFMKAAEKEIIDEYIEKTARGVPKRGVIRCKDVYSEPFRSLKHDFANSKNCWAYVVWDQYAHNPFVAWGPDPEILGRRQERREATAKEKEAERKRNLDLANEAATAFFGKLFDPNGKGLHDFENCVDIISEYPSRILAQIVAEHLDHVRPQTWGDARLRTVLRFAREVPAARSLISAEQFKALEFACEGGEA